MFVVFVLNSVFASSLNASKFVPKVDQPVSDVQFTWFSVAVRKSFEKDSASITSCRVATYSTFTL